jgi:hypothetical protein
MFSRIHVQFKAFPRLCYAFILQIVQKLWEYIRVLQL